MKNIDFIFMIDKASKELEKVVNFFNENNKYFESVNLKLYNAFFEATNEEETELFYLMCNDLFEQLENETEYKTLSHYIGQTSSFYCFNDNLLITERNNKIVMNDTIYNYFYELYGWNNILLEIKENNKIDTYSLLKDVEKYNCQYDAIHQLQYIITGEFLEDIKKYFEPSFYLFDYIQDIKNDQINIFNYYKLNY